jgi:hypothetical protein
LQPLAPLTTPTRRFFHASSPICHSRGPGASLVVGFAGAGCESDSDKPLAYKHEPLKGAALHEIPAGATVVKEGHEPLLFQVPSDGTVWVYNASDKRWSTPPPCVGQNIEVDPDHDFVTVDGKKVLDTKMDDFDKHQILFAPASVARR